MARGWPWVRRVMALALVLALVIPAPAPANEDDEGFLTRTLQSLLSDAGREVRIRGFEGALSSRATLREMTIADDQGVWLILRDAALDWDRSALFSRRVEINRLTAGRIEILRPPVTGDSGIELPSATARAPFALPELPVAIHIGELRADSVWLGAPILGESAEVRLQGRARLEAGEGEAGFEADRIDGGEGQFRLSGSFDNRSRRLVLDLSLAEGAGGIAAGLLGIPDRPALALAARGDDPIANFRAAIRLDTDGQQRVAGRVTFVDTTPEGGLLDGALFRLDLGGDLRPLLAPELHGFFGPDSRLTAEGSRDEDGALHLRELTAVTRALTLDGGAELGPDGLPRRIDLRLDLAGPDGQPVVLPGTDGVGRLGSAALLVGFDVTRGPDWSVLGRLVGLDLPDLAIAEVALDGRGRLGALDGPAANGPLFDGVLEFAAQGIAAADPALQAALGPQLLGLVSLLVPADGGPLQIGGLGLEGETLVLSGAGTLDGLTFDGYLEAEAPDLAPFSGLAGLELGGAALIELRGRVQPVTGELDIEAGLTTTDLTLDIPEADALLAGRAGIGLSLRRDTEGTQLRRLTVQAGTLGLSAQGRIAPGDTRLEARLGLTDLARLGNGYAGAARLELDYREREDAQRQLDLSGEVVDLALGRGRPGAAQVGGLFRGTTRLAARVGQAEGTTTIEHLALNGPQLALRGSGRLDDQGQSLALLLDRLALAPLAAGLGGTLSGRLDLGGAVGARRLGLELGAAGAVRTGQAPLDALLARGLTLTAQAREADGGHVIETARLTAPGLDLRASGVQRADGALSLALDGGIEDVGRLVPGLDGAARVEARLGRPAGADDIDASLALTGPSALNLAARGRIGPDARLALTLSGSVEAGIANPFIAPWTVQGDMALSGSVNGPPALSSLRLNIRTGNGRFIMPGSGVAFTGIAARGDLSGDRLDFDLNGESMRGGAVSLAGSMELANRQMVDVAASADRFRVVVPRLFEGSVSGNVRVQGSLVTGPTASGRITIDEVEIRIPNSPLGRAGHIPDGLRHVGESADSRRTRLNAGLAQTETRQDRGGGAPLNLDLTLEAPGRVFVRGRGLDAELGGRLHLAGTTRDTIPSGAFTLIRGRMDLLGSRFTLTDGAASLQGSFIPQLRLIASTDSGGVVTSIILEGPADGPEIRFESVPQLPQDEVLARLIFGRALASLSPFQAAQLAMSVATLTGRSESNFLDRTRTALGLDDLDVSTDADGNTALRAGRYIGERVYADVGVNSAGRSEVRLQLELSPSLTLRGRTDSAGRSSLGVYFERDY